MEDRDAVSGKIVTPEYVTPEFVKLIGITPRAVSNGGKLRVVDGLEGGDAWMVSCALRVGAEGLLE